MKRNYSRFFKILKLTVFFLGLFFFRVSYAQDIVSTEDGNWHEVIWNPSRLPESSDNVQISNSLVIEQDSIVEINNLNIASNGEINVFGTLVVYGNITMDNNGSNFKMQNSARVIVFGDFLASNKIDISISSYLIIQGSFIKQGSSGQGTLDIDDGNIYIYGEVDGWANFGGCDEAATYSGTPQESGTCDYGDEDDFVNNPDIPEEIINISNCYDLTGISSEIVCEGSSAIFSVAFNPDVNYQWQEKTGDSNWINVGLNSNVYTISNALIEQNGNLYRVIVKPKDTVSSQCKLSISLTASLNVQRHGIWNGSENNNWNNSANWSCNFLPTSQTDVLIPENLASGNYPEVTAGTNAFARNLSIENNASVIVNDNWLRIAGNLTNLGTLNLENGSVSFEGSLAQTIPNSAFENNRVKNLRINNLTGVNSEAKIEITRTLKVEAGTFDTGDDLTLISNATQTALIDGSGSGEITGLVSMQRYLDKAFGYKFFSSPFNNATVNDFSPYIDFQDPVTGFPHFYRYDENRRVDSLDLDATGWVSYVDPGNALNVSEGYAINFGASTGPQTVQITGEINNGPIAAKELLNHQREYTKGFHLVGNPYPSPIDWEATAGWTRNNIDNGIYFFTASDTDQYTGTYTAYVNDISTANPLEDGRSSNIIPSMQGFFIKVSDSETQNIVTASFGMNNKVRVVDLVQDFLKSPIKDQKPVIRLEAGFKNMEQKDAMVIYFSSLATANFEKELDAFKLKNTNPAVPSFYNITEDSKELAINAIPFPEYGSYKKIPLGINVEQGGEMTINLSSMENLSSNFNVYLIDHEKNIGQNLSQDSEYSFKIKAGKHNSRFEIMFSEEKVSNPAIAFNEPFDVKLDNGQVKVSLNLEENQNGILRASTITGQILQIRKAKGKDEVIFDGITSNGIYIINLQLDQKQYAKKVLIKK